MEKVEERVFRRDIEFGGWRRSTVVAGAYRDESDLQLRGSWGNHRRNPAEATMSTAGELVGQYVRWANCVEGQEAAVAQGSWTSSLAAETGTESRRVEIKWRAAGAGSGLP
ncbi:MAG: hypothetical protein M1822_008621 [Bathelium mastoideum]|nr:MAG: hypothetical protein M1822_008621 [Bathelium mastoideum]